MKLYRHSFNSMGCPCEIGVYGNSSQTALTAMTEAADEVHRLDRKYSHFRKSSHITRLQLQAAKPGGAMVDDETSALLNYAATQFELSGGLFDITAGCLSRLWHTRATLPSLRSLDKARQYTGWAKLRWQQPRLELPEGMRLELGGVVKEYAADRAALILVRRGLHSAFVELGGDIHVTGPHPDGSPWNMGIRDPDHRQNAAGFALAGIPVFSGGLATSGDYERGSLINGRRYGHIINPITGWPVDGLQSVSVHAPSCLLAGSISTLAMLMGTMSGLAMLDESGLAWLARSADGVSCSGSSGDQRSSDRHPLSSAQMQQQQAAMPIDNRPCPPNRSTSAPRTPPPAWQKPA
jgi:thiamine biosynthesis lipoprotein